jgi:hypothetical protein
MAAWLAEEPPHATPVNCVPPLQEIRHVWAATHFCSRRLPGASIDPRSFVRNITNQLAFSFPALYETLTRSSAPAVINSSFIVARNEGQTTGIQVENLWLGSVPILDAFDRAVRQPLELLATEAPKMIALLIDGLDESLGVDQTTIADLVANLAEPPGAIKVLITTKPDRRILELFPDARIVDLDYGEYHARSSEDLAEYIQREIGHAAPDAARKLAAAANGNFMYARHVIRDVNPDLLAGGAKLPDGLSQLYGQYLARLVPKQTSESQEFNDHVSFLGLLSVAFEPLTMDVIGEILGMSKVKVNTIADDLQQIIAFTGDDSVRIQFFHSSMADFVANQPKIRSAPNAYYASAAEQHLKVVRSYVRRFGDFRSSEWSHCDGYGLHYLPAHMSAAIDQGTQEVTVAQLFDLVLNPAFIQGQLSNKRDDAVIRAGNIAIDISIRGRDFGSMMRLTHEFSQSNEILLNGIATTALVRWHSEFFGLEILKLLRDPSPRVRRVATNAAYQVGLGADVIAIMARDRDEGLQRTVAYMAYLEWVRGNRSTVMTFADAIADGIRWIEPMDAYRRIRFLGHCLIFIYTNNPNDQQLIAWGDRLFRQVLARKARISAITIPAPIKSLAMVISGRVLSSRATTAVLSANLQDPKEYFKGAVRNRDLLRKAAALLDPETDWITSFPDIVDIWNSDIVFIRGYGSIVSFANYLRSANVDEINTKIRDDFEYLTPRARLWLLLSFSPLFQEAPILRPLVAWLTKYILEHDRDFLVTRDYGQLKGWNVFLIPLGLASGKVNSSMVEIEDPLLNAIRDDDRDLVNVMIESLGLVGFYYPRQALPLLAIVCNEAGSSVDDSLVEALSTIALLHPEEVDVVLRDTGRLDLRADVLARSDIVESEFLFDKIAFFSNAVNQAWQYPAMREMLVRGTVQHIASAKSARDFRGRLTRTIVQVMRDSSHEIGVWGRHTS